MHTLAPTSAANHTVLTLHAAEPGFGLESRRELRPTTPAAAAGSRPPAAMPTVAQLVKEASKLKVKEVPSHVQKFAGQHWTPAQLQARVSNWMQNYKTQVRQQ